MKKFLTMLLKWAVVIIVAAFVQCILYAVAEFCVMVADLDLRHLVTAMTSIWLYVLTSRMERSL